MNKNAAVSPGTRFASQIGAPTLRFGNGTAVISSVASVVVTLFTAYSCMVGLMAVSIRTCQTPSQPLSGTSIVTFRSMTPSLSIRPSNVGDAMTRTSFGSAADTSDILSVMRPLNDGLPVLPTIQRRFNVSPEATTFVRSITST